MGEMDHIDYAIEQDIANEEKKALAEAESGSESEVEVTEAKKRCRTVKDFRGKYANNKSNGVMYLGHIPDGFMEAQMRKYFSQYGSVFRIRLSRNRKTGNSRGYAFIEFESPEVAEIVAETMNGYRMFGRTMQAKAIPAEKLHRRVWYGMGIASRKKFNARAFKRDLKTEEGVMGLKQFARLAKGEKKRNQKLKDLGIDYSFEVMSVAENKTQMRKEAEQAFAANQEPVKAWKAEKEQKKVAHKEHNQKLHAEAVERKLEKKKLAKDEKIAARKAKAEEADEAKVQKMDKKRKADDAFKQEAEKNAAIIEKANKKSEEVSEKPAKVAKTASDKTKKKKVKK